MDATHFVVSTSGVPQNAHADTCEWGYRMQLDYKDQTAKSSFLHYNIVNGLKLTISITDDIGNLTLTLSETMNSCSHEIVLRSA